MILHFTIILLNFLLLWNIGLGGRGFGRIDVRSDPSGEVLQFLEMNPNCGVFYPPGSFGSADEILQFDGTTSHADFLHHLIECALAEQRRKQPLFEAIYVKGKGFGLYAKRDIKQGEIIQVVY